MQINLVSTGLFEQDQITFDKNVNFIFGKNGSGKSTLCKLIKNQLNSSYDVRVFQGFESVVGENNKLDTVILGEENTEINNQIEIKEQEKSNKQLEINKIKENIEQSEANPNNLWKEYDEQQKVCNQIQSEIHNFFTNSAREIKNHSPQISTTTYRKDDFESELNRGCLLEQSRIEELERVLRSEIKNATELNLTSLNVDFEKLLEDVNAILLEKVQERTSLTRLEGTSEKREFARKGLSLHKAGDCCSFCNSIISQETITELETYFSADEIRALESKIKDKIEHLNQIRFSYNRLNINEQDFYPDLYPKVKEIKNEIDIRVRKIDNFINILLSELDKKLKNLFESNEQLERDYPESILAYIEKYNGLVKQNNSSKLVEKQSNAKSELRYHFIKKYGDEFNFNVKNNDLKNAKENLDGINKKIENENKKIDLLFSEIKKIDEEILALQEQTRNEKILIEKINKKLKLYASFELIHQEESNDYKIKCLRTNKIRSVIELSTGEKNIIAFLYFLNKLEEHNVSSLAKCIVFDDPMNSNDDLVQYLIIEELQNLAKNIKGNARLIILTHNKHFYINVKYGFKYNSNRFYHFIKLNHKTSVTHIAKEDDDFETSYGSLWLELKILNSNESINASLLLNPIRRIIETYTKFNGVKSNDFFENISGARKLFNVNSHSIDDLEAELNGKNKDEIITLLKECFEKNNAIVHFNKYMGIDEL